MCFVISCLVAMEMFKLVARKPDFTLETDLEDVRQMELAAEERRRKREQKILDRKLWLRKRFKREGKVPLQAHQLQQLQQSECSPTLTDSTDLEEEPETGGEGNGGRELAGWNSWLPDLPQPRCSAGTVLVGRYTPRTLNITGMLTASGAET